MRTNTAVRYTEETHEGGKAFAHMTPIQALRRSVLSCLLFEREFYEGGEDIAARILTLCDQVSTAQIGELAVEARSKFNLRHAPLLLLTAMIKRGGTGVADAIAETIQRADELSELVALYWRDGKRPLSKQLKTGLARAFVKFDAYALAKYNRDAAVKLRDVLFLCHANPKDEEQAATWKLLVDGKLPAPDTWEVALSSGSDKAATWSRLIGEGQLGYLALLRNLRNMTDAGVDAGIIRDAILSRKGARRVLPFRYVAAARACPRLEPAIDQALSEAISEIPALPGRTVVLVDVSGSMRDRLSQRSDMTRMDAAAALAALIHGEVRMFSFSEALVEVPPRRGMAGVDAIVRSQEHRGTHLFDAVSKINATIAYDRLIVITDEQATGGHRMGYLQGSLKSLPDPTGVGYMINVASAKNGVGYGAWRHIDGFSENVIRWIHEVENDAQGTV